MSTSLFGRYLTNLPRLENGNITFCQIFENEMSLQGMLLVCLHPYFTGNQQMTPPHNSIT